nr:YadA-like family protein [Luteimonas galliterrae]
MGNQNKASGFASNAFGLFNEATNTGSIAFGSQNKASGGRSVAMGHLSTASGDGGLAIGGWFDADNSDGFENDVDTDNNGMVDASSELTRAGGTHAIAIGAGAWATGEHAIAFGTGSMANVDDGVALGTGSVADRGNTISVGSAGNERQITNVAAATELTDAVNLGQLKSELEANLASAFAYTDTAVATGGTAANAYTDDQIANVKQDMEAGDVATLSAANQHADAGDVATLSAANQHADAGDAATLSAANQRADAGDSATLSAANTYTDSKFAGFNDRFEIVDQRINRLDDRLNRAGALSAAMVGMAASAAAVEGGQTRVGIAAGTYGGKQALSVGVQHRLGSRAALTLGGAFSGSEHSASVGMGIGF